MATIVLIHGAWHGSWCWKRVRRSLQDLGHDVFTPTLTGVGERSHLLTQTVNLDTHVADVLNLIRWEQLSDILLCGHSYGGMVVTAVANRIPGSIRSLVYLDAFVPEHGQSLTEFAPVSAEQVLDGWKVKPISAEAFGVNDADRLWVNQQCTLQPLGCFEQPVRLSAGITTIDKIHYLYASGWAGGRSPFYHFYEKAKTAGWRTSEIDCGHDVMLDRPDALSDFLVSCL